MLLFRCATVYGGGGALLCKLCTLASEASRCVTVLSCVTNRCANQEKLRTAMYKAQAAAISGTHGVVSLTPEGIIIDTNGIFLKTMGYARDELVGKDCRSINHEKSSATRRHDQLWTRLRSGWRFVSFRASTFLIFSLSIVFFFLHLLRRPRFRLPSNSSPTADAGSA